VSALNYKHLHYFWTIVKAGGVARAAERLHVTPQSISGQIRLLSEAIGEPLLRRAGRNLELTDSGRLVFEYADRAFGAFAELQGALAGAPGARHQPQFRVGVSNVLGRSVAYSLLRPALLLPQPPRLICRDGRLPDLLGELALHRLDLVLSDRPMDTSLNVRAFNHLLGECGITFLAAPTLARRLRGGFPRSLDGAPMLLHGESSALRPRLERWFEQHHVQPRIVAEFDDTALLKAFAQEGAGAFGALTLVADQIAKQYALTAVGRTDEIVEQVYAISTERRVTHPAVLAISRTARNEAFAGFEPR
jgi:LysR family transcriptional activator of nhaA